MLLISPNVTMKIVINSIFNMIKNNVIDIEDKISRYKDDSSDQKYNRLMFHMKIYILVAAATLANKTKVINLVLDKRSSNNDDIKGLLSLVLNIFIKENVKSIKILKINNTDIKNLILQYYKNILNNDVIIEASDTSFLSYDTITKNPYYILISYYNNIYNGKKLNINQFFNTGEYNYVALKNLKLHPFDSTINTPELYRKNSLLLQLYKLKNLDYTDKDKLKEVKDKCDAMTKKLLTYEKLESFEPLKKIPLMPFTGNKYKFTDYMRNLDERHIEHRYNYDHENYILFFNIFVFKCPVINNHEFQNAKCMKCKVTIEKLQNKDKDYYKEYKNVLLNQIINNKKNKQKNLNMLFNNTKEKNNLTSRPELDVIELNIANIDKLSDMVNKDKVFFMLLGDIENLDYNANTLSNLDPSYSYTRCIKLENYIYWFLIEYNIIFKGSIKSMSQLNKYNDYQISHDYKSICNMLLNYLFELMLNGLELAKTDKDKYNTFLSKIDRVFRFDELLTKYNYADIRDLLQKGYTPDSESSTVVNKELEYDISNQSYNYNDVFDASLFSVEDM